MRGKHRLTAAIGVVAIAACLVLSGCGRKGPPEAPVAPAGAAITAEPGQAL